MSVNTICNHNVVTVEPRTGIVEAAVLMRDQHVGDLIVVEHRKALAVPIGIITDRDIVVTIVARGVNPGELTVADAMSSGLLTVNADSSVEVALREMQRVGVRRIPVVDNTNNLVGVLSIDDILDHLAVQLEHIANIIRLEQQVELQKRP